MYYFYVFYSNKQIIVSDLDQNRVRKRYGNKIELINSVKDKDSIELIKPRILRNYSGFQFVEEFQKPKYVMTPEHKQALINSKLGKKRSEEVRKKISLAKKGKSNFEGKKHTYETKRLMSALKIGQAQHKDYIWVHNPETDKELMVKDRFSIPKGFSQGRDYYSTEPGLYEMNIMGRKSRSRNRK